MPETPAADPTGDTVTLRIAAPPDRLYAIVSDITRMGELSPECTGGKWLGGATGPAVGARFRGNNKRGWFRWSTTNEVVAADPGREFAFQTRESGIRWSYAFEADGDSTVVTERRTPWRDRPFIARMGARLFMGGVAEHDDELRDGMRATLERLKSVAETP